MGLAQDSPVSTNRISNVCVIYHIKVHSSITQLKKIQNPNLIFCPFSDQCHLKRLQWRQNTWENQALGKSRFSKVFSKATNARRFLSLKFYEEFDQIKSVYDRKNSVTFRFKMEPSIKDVSIFSGFLTPPSPFRHFQLVFDPPLYNVTSFINDPYFKI